MNLTKELKDILKLKINKFPIDMSVDEICSKLCTEMHFYDKTHIKQAFENWIRNDDWDFVSILSEDMNKYVEEYGFSAMEKEVFWIKDGHIYPIYDYLKELKEN